MRQLFYDIDGKQDGMSVNEYARNIAGVSRGFLRSIKFKDNGITVNGERVTTRYVLHAGDRLVFTMDYDDSQRVVPMVGDVDILYEDEDMVLVDKEAGRVVHPCHGHYEDTLLNHLAWYYRNREQQPLLCPVGRLDKDTSGLILVARNKYAARVMEQEREDGRLSRIYLALTEGHLFPEDMSDQIQTVDRPIAKVADVFNRYEVSDKGKPSRTFYKVLARASVDEQPFSIVMLKLETGRTHQIRVHMASMGHPLLGDPIYGQEGMLGIRRAALHSIVIGCVLPKNGETRIFDTNLPEDFRRLFCQAGIEEDELMHHMHEHILAFIDQQ